MGWPSNPGRLSLMLMRGGLEPSMGQPSNLGWLSLMLNKTTVTSCCDAKRRDAIIAYAMLRHMRMDASSCTRKVKWGLVKFMEILPAMSEWNSGLSFMTESA